MKQEPPSRAFLVFDIALFTSLLLPLAAVVALRSDRTKAAVIYGLVLLSIVALTIAVRAVSRVSFRTYLATLREQV